MNNTSPDISNIRNEMSLNLSKIEAAFLFLDEMNNKPDRPRNVTEQNTVGRNLRRVREVREMFKILNRDTTDVSSPVVDITRLAAQQFLHDS